MSSFMEIFEFLSEIIVMSWMKKFRDYADERKDNATNKNEFMLMSCLSVIIVGAGLVSLVVLFLLYIVIILAMTLGIMVGGYLLIEHHTMWFFISLGVLCFIAIGIAIKNHAEQEWNEKHGRSGSK